MRVSIRSCLWGWFNHVHSKLFPQVGCSLHHDKEMLHYDWSQGRFGRTLPAMRWPPSRKIEGHTRIRFTIYTWSPTTTLCHTLLRDEFQFNETSQFVSAGGWEKHDSNYHQITMAILFWRGVFKADSSSYALGWWWPPNPRYFASGLVWGIFRFRRRPCGKFLLLTFHWSSPWGSPLCSGMVVLSAQRDFSWWKPDLKMKNWYSFALYIWNTYDIDDIWIIAYLLLIAFVSLIKRTLKYSFDYILNCLVASPVEDSDLLWVW